MLLRQQLQILVSEARARERETKEEKIEARQYVTLSSNVNNLCPVLPTSI